MKPAYIGMVLSRLALPKRPIRAVSKESWKLSECLGERRKRLLDGLDPRALLDKVLLHAAQASTKGELSLCWQRSCERPETGRLVGQIKLDEEVFDQLFNGRSGYRAQYYLSPDEGILFNRDLIVGFHNAIKTAYSYASLGVDFPVIERSLLGPYSKIWIYGEREAFDSSKPNLVNPQRWVKNDACRGRKAPLPQHFKVDLKGTFVEPKGPGMFIDELKLDRACGLHSKGYT